MGDTKFKTSVEPAQSRPGGNKLIQIPLEELKNENPEMYQMLKDWDLDGDGKFSLKEIQQAAKAKKKADAKIDVLQKIVMVSITLLILSGIGNMGTTLYAIRVSKEAHVKPTSPVMLNVPPGDKKPQAVATAELEEQVDNIAELIGASKEDLDNLKDISFFHDGGYHRIIVSQIHRFDGRLEVWGCPYGMLIVEDTGEVHYAPFGTPGEQSDKCWDENAGETQTALCGVLVDNEPPNKLHADEPGPPPSNRRLLAERDDMDINGEELDEDLASARRLASRRRAPSSSSSSSSSSSRRRSGHTTDSRRRSGGSFNKKSSHKSRRLKASSGYDGGGDGRRRRHNDVNYYHSDECPEGEIMRCEDYEGCWCEEDHGAADGAGVIIIIIVLISLCICCCVLKLFFGKD